MRVNIRQSRKDRPTKTIWLLLISQLCIGSLLAQNTHPAAIGIIKSNNNEILSHVMVRVENADNTVLANTVTNEKGIFTFAKLPAGGPYRFIFTHIGYTTDTLKGYTITDSSKLSLSVVLKKKWKS